MFFYIEEEDRRPPTLTRCEICDNPTEDPSVIDADDEDITVCATCNNELEDAP